MTEEKKHDDKDREKVSDEEMEDVAGGGPDVLDNGFATNLKKGKKKPGNNIVSNPYPSSM